MKRIGQQCKFKSAIYICIAAVVYKNEIDNVRQGGMDREVLILRLLPPP
jgi:hypothetical protein